jgi:hypothetical protein
MLVSTRTEFPLELLDRKYSDLFCEFQRGVRLGLIEENIAYMFKVVDDGTLGHAIDVFNRIVEMHFENPQRYTTLKLLGFDIGAEISREMFIERVDRLLEIMRWFNDSFECGKLNSDNARWILSLIRCTENGNPKEDLRANQISRLNYAIYEKLREDLASAESWLKTSVEVGVVNEARANEIRKLPCLIDFANEAYRVICEVRASAR